MTEKLTSLVACTIAIAAMAITIAGLVAYTVLTFDKTSELHDRVIIAEQIALDWEKAYGKLLERLGGSGVPDINLPPRPQRPNGVKTTKD